MNKPKFDPNQPFQVADKPPFDPSQPFEAQQANNKTSIPQIISTIQRPLLEAGGAVGGGIIGSGLGPIGTVGGGALGFATGKSGADLVDRMLGVKKPIKNVSEALGETAGNIKQGAEAEMAGQIGGKVLSAAQKPISKFAGNMGRIISGVKPEVGQRLFKDPGALFSPSLESAGTKLGSIRNEMGMTAKPTIDEVVDTEASIARKTMKDVVEKIRAKTASAIDLLKGAQATDDVIQATPNKQTNKLRLLYEQKREFTDALKNVAPEERAAAKEYARSALGSEFRKLLPVTQAGNVSVMRTLGLGALEGGGGKLAAIVPSLLQSPFLSGLGISTAGELNKVLLHPQIRRAVVAALADIRKKK